MEKYEIVIIGSGPGGYVAAIRAAQLKKKVCVVEKGSIGGVCLNIGCVPTKTLIASAEVYAEAKKASEFGVDIKGKIEYSLADIMERKKKVVLRTVKGVEFLLRKNGVDVKRGTAQVISPEKVLVNDEVISAEHIIIATGSKPKIIKGLEPDGKLILTSKEALEIDEMPESLLIVGAGVIGVEMATFFNLLDSNVTIVEMLDTILPGIGSKKMASALRAQLNKRGVEILTSTTVVNIEKGDRSVDVRFSNDDRKSFDKILVAIGRAVNLDGINVDELGIELDKGFIRTNERMMTSIDGVYAIGDVRGGMLLAHKASREGVVAVENVAGENSIMNYDAVPSCIFSSPPAAIVGLTEEMAIERGVRIKVGEYQYIGNSRALSLGEKEGYVKIIADDAGRVLGGEIVGAGADSMISEITMACEYQMNIKELDRLIHPHPTLSEIVMEAFHDANGKSIHKPPR